MARAWGRVRDVAHAAREEAGIVGRGCGYGYGGECSCYRQSAGDASFGEVRGCAFAQTVHREQHIAGLRSGPLERVHCSGRRSWAIWDDERERACLRVAEKSGGEGGTETAGYAIGDDKVMAGAAVQSAFR